MLVAASIFLRLATLSLYPVPLPHVHDEFSYIIGAQTFSEGRFTNPALVFPDSFREIHVLSEPTRMAKYQPGASATMAIGKLLFGNFYWGVVIVMSLLPGVAFWAMASWTDKRIGFIGAVILLLLLRAPHYWMSSYWGGGLITLACFLILGAYAQLFIHRRYHYIWVGMLGVFLALFTRPLESGVLLFCLSAVAIHTLAHYPRAELLRFLKITVPPAMLVMTAYASMQMYYNFKVTGDVWTLPYMRYNNAYNATPFFTFGQLYFENISAHPVLQSTQRWELTEYLEKGNFFTAFAKLYHALMNLVSVERSLFPGVTIYASMVLVLVACVIPLHQLIISRNTGGAYLEKTGALYFAYIMLMVLFLLISWSLPHYMSPFFATLCCLLACIAYEHKEFFRDLEGKTLENRIKKIYIWFTVFFVLMPPYTFAEDSAHLKNKAHIEKKLLQTNEKHLVFVDQLEEAKARPIHQSWVYNAADMDNAQIIWAWYLTPKENKKVMEYYHDRKIWYIKPSSYEFPIPYSDAKVTKP